MKNFIGILFVFSTIFTSNIFSQDKPIQLALFNPVQLFPENTSVTGLRLSLLYGKNNTVTGIDIGLVNETTSVQKGIQWGLVGLTKGGFTGFQTNFVSISKGNFEGLQWSFVNHHSGHFNGLQLSFVNYTTTLKGLQIGLINIISQGGFMPIFPIFNFSFD
jgi:hypothetical protein